MNKPYSLLAFNIREKIAASTVDATEITGLIKQSFDLLTMHPTDISKSLHNKLLEMLLNQHPNPELQHLQEVYFWPSKSIEVLEHLFGLDPSNFTVVFQLGVEYAVLGRHKRAKQLLNRVARSGYNEKDLAMNFLKERYGEEQWI